jgi:bifunctional oligoribonuclease and PAP phosphatase NrnA
LNRLASDLYLFFHLNPGEKAHPQENENASMEKITEHDQGTLNDIEAIIQAHERFLICSHTHTDGDAVGSSLAFKRMLEQMGKDVLWVMDEDPGETFERFYNNGELEIYSETSNFSNREVIVMTDAGEWHRLGAIGDILKNHPGQKLCIDHHYPINDFHGTRFVRVKSPSTTVIMYNLFKHLGLEWNKQIAEPIYLGIIVDTLNFHLPHTNAQTHTIAAECIEAGVNPTYVYEPIYGTTSPARLRLMTQAFHNIEILCGGKVATMHVTQQMLRETGATRNDDDGFVEFLRTLKGVVVAIYIREESEGRAKVSWRAKGDNNIVVSAQRFGGGGHMRAAGASIQGSVEEIRRTVLENMKQRVENGEIR